MLLIKRLPGEYNTISLLAAQSSRTDFLHPQDFASAGANMYTFHLEAVVPEATTAKHPDPQMVKVLKEVKEAGMHAGVALKPKTPAETLFPYIEDKLVDQVHTEHVCAVKVELGSCLLAVEAHT